jgi:hypothetical protein
MLIEIAKQNGERPNIRLQYHKRNEAHVIYISCTEKGIETRQAPPAAPGLSMSFQLGHEGFVFLYVLNVFDFLFCFC